MKETKVIEKYKIEAAKRNAKAAKRFIARVDRIKKWVSTRPESGEDESAWIESRPPQRAFPSKNAKHTAYDKAGCCRRLIPALKDAPLMTLDDMREIVKYVEVYVK